MTVDYYCPHSNVLKPFFGRQSKIDSREKAFAFVLGVLIGAILHCRSRHDDHAKSKLFPLSQLLSMTGDDLMALYDKVMRELDCGIRSSKENVESIADEARHLRASLFNLNDLDEATTTYFILYGISVSASICSSNARKVKKCQIT